MNKRTLFVVMMLFVAACATTPTGQRVLHLFPSGEVDQMGDAAFQKMLKEEPVSQDAKLNEYVQCVANAVVTGLPEAGKGPWKVSVFDKDEVNAFALPGGNIGVYKGILKTAETPGQLAAVIAHEVAHVIAEHPNARLSTEYATQTGVQLIGLLAGSADSAGSRQILSLLGLGAQVGVVLPFSRDQEREADILGMDYMTRAGFDPAEAVQLWKNMMRRGGGRVPEFLSTHPANEARVRVLEEHLREVRPLYERFAGSRPRCEAPR